MPVQKNRPHFADTPEGVTTSEILKEMMRDKAYNTRPSYSANSDLYPKGVISFVDKHMDYLRAHPQTQVRHYIANLRLITRKK